MKKRLVLLCICLASQTARADPQLTDRQSCERYAQNAVEDYLKIRKIPACYKGDNGRWHSNYEKHYNWCASASPQDLDKEERLRTASIARCIAENGDHGAED